MPWHTLAVNKLATSPTSPGEMLPTSRGVSCRDALMEIGLYGSLRG